MKGFKKKGLSCCSLEISNIYIRVYIRKGSYVTEREQIAYEEYFPPVFLLGKINSNKKIKKI
jgi:hypothetical protein